MRKTAFIGHSRIFAGNLPERLMSAITAEIQNGCLSFTMGTHGEFDKLALYVCRKLRETFSDLQIEVVITSLNAIKKGNEEYAAPYADVKTVMFDIEETHFKRQITLSNRNMIDSCDTLICYVDTKRYQSGAKTALNYAKRKGLRIINLYLEEDAPFYGITKEEIKESRKKFCERTSMIK